MDITANFIIELNEFVLALETQILSSNSKSLKIFNLISFRNTISTFALQTKKSFTQDFVWNSNDPSSERCFRIAFKASRRRDSF